MTAPTGPGRRGDRLAGLREQVRRVEGEQRGGRANARAGDGGRRIVPTGWADVDAALDGGLAIGRLHEWLGVCDAASHETAPDHPQHHRAHRHWRPPLCLMAHLARQAVTSTHHRADGCAPHDHAGALIVWIGARCRPFWPMLARLRDAHRFCDLIQQSIFVDAREQAERVWSIDLALRCPAVTAVIADAGGFTRAETRRLQLAAENGSTLALLVRPPRERNELTTASTRWLVAHSSSPTVNSQWTVRLLRCKGVRPTSTEETAHAWLLEWAHETGDVRPPADVVDRPDVAAHSPPPEAPEVRTSPAQSTGATHQRRSA